MTEPDPLAPYRGMIALSVRQPWATSILNGKPVENRSWPDRYRDMQLAMLRRAGGRFVLHASKILTPEVCQDWHDFIFMRIPLSEIRWALDVRLSELPRGGIVGIAQAAPEPWVTQHSSKWFTGPGAIVIEKVEAVPFVPLRGAQGFFTIR